MITKKCLQCGKIFGSHPSRIQKFCSYECSRRARMFLKEKECAFCHKMFRPRTSMTKYCSKECSYEAKKRNVPYEKRKCMNCGQDFEVKPSYGEKFCCMKCYRDYIHANGSFATYPNRGKTYEELYGKEKAEKIREKQRSHKLTPEQKERVRRQMTGTKRSPETCEKLRLIQLSPEHQKKINDTKRKNGTFNKSKNEDEIKTLLEKRFEKVETQHKEERYPFMCDFYISSLDLFIEYQGHWTHGGRYGPYDENNQKHQEIIDKWRNKAKEKEFYETAIEVWTVRDPLKRKVAKDNKLNWLEFFTMKEFMKWYSSI